MEIKGTRSKIKFSIKLAVGKNNREAYTNEENEIKGITSFKCEFDLPHNFIFIYKA